MKIVQTKILSANQKASIHKMWNDEYPLKLKDRFPLLLEGVDNYTHYIIENERYNLIGWAVAFEKENQMRFSIIIHSDEKGKGFGRRLVDILKEKHNNLYGWVIDHNEAIKSNGKQYQTPMPFYLKQGFTILNEPRLESERISAALIHWDRNKDNQ